MTSKKSLDKPSAEQLKVLSALVTDNCSDLVYYKGGFWGPPGQALSARFGAPERWHTGRSTVASLERKGWIKAVPGTSYKRYFGLETRRITATGLEVVASYLKSISQAASQKRDEIVQREVALHFNALSGDLKVEPDNLAVGRTWACAKSPTGYCVYDNESDLEHDSCLYCGDPSERK